MQQQRLFICGPAGRLQSLYVTGNPARPAVVICHPHPQYGGTMRNKVVHWMAQAFAERGCAVLRFNFRGVEESAGEWGDGVGEIADAAAALDWLHERCPDAPLWLAGFSFGCYAGLHAARDNARVARLFAVAPAVNLYDFSFIDGDTRPLTVVHGDADEVVPYDASRQWAEQHPQVVFHTISGAGHFFPKHASALTEALLEDASFALHRKP